MQGEKERNLVLREGKKMATSWGCQARRRKVEPAQSRVVTVYRSQVRSTPYIPFEKYICTYMDPCRNDNAPAKEIILDDGKKEKKRKETALKLD